MKLRHTLQMITMTLALGACGSTPELQQSEKRAGPMSMAKPFESGTMAGAVYTPSAAEQALDCKKLKGSMLIIVAREVAISVYSR